MCKRSVFAATSGLLVLVAMTIAWATGPAAAASPSELLQKAIYTEETVGDLDEAMKLYEQVIAEGKAGQEAAAQAQYRLALCYEKKGRDTDAKAAFEKLIENYPNAKGLVAEARKHLPSKELKLLPAPWQLGERMQLNMKLPTGVDIGTMIYMVDGAEHDGTEVLRCSTRGLVTVSDANSYSEVFCEPESFQPIKSFWKHSQLGEATAVYGDTSAVITVVGKDKTFTIDFTPPVFDNEQGVELFRRLPLAVGYKTTISIITSLGGNKIELPVSVSGIETITVPAGTFECYKLELGLVNQTFWISTDEHRYVVRFAAGGVTADLAKVWQAHAESTEKVSGNDFSFTLPPGWMACRASKTLRGVEGTEVFLLDPRADALGQIEVRPKRTLKPDERQSSKAWTESVNNEFKNVYPDFTLREPAFRDVEVGGKKATAIVADFTEKGDKKALYSVAVIGDQSAVALRLGTEREKFAELRTAFDEIVESFQLK